MTFCIWFLSLSIMFLKFTYVAAHKNFLFLFVAEWYSAYFINIRLWVNIHTVLNIPHFLTHSPVEGHVDCFHYLATMNKAVRNISYKSLCGHMFSFLLARHCEVLSHNTLFVHLRKTAELISKVVAPLYMLIRVYKGSSFSTSSVKLFFLFVCLIIII